MYIFIHNLIMLITGVPAILNTNASTNITTGHTNGNLSCYKYSNLFALPYEYINFYIVLRLFFIMYILTNNLFC